MHSRFQSDVQMHRLFRQASIAAARDCVLPIQKSFVDELNYVDDNVTNNARETDRILDSGFQCST